MKLRFTILFCLFLCRPSLGAYDYYYKLSTLAQDVDYVSRTLIEILQPSEYSLILDSIHISDAVGGKGMQTTYPGGISYPQLGEKIKNSKYTLRVVRFSALTESKAVVSGWTYLAVARTDSSNRSLVALNSQARQGWSETWKSAYWSSLVLNDESSSFVLDLRPLDLHLTAGFEVPETSLPNWGVPRDFYPRASSVSIFNYLNQFLGRILKPVNFELLPETIDIDLQVLISNGPNFPPSLRIVETPIYTARTISFIARGPDQNLYRGLVYVILAVPAAKELTPNDSLQPAFDTQKIRVTDLFLSVGANLNNFPLDVRSENLNLTRIQSFN